MFHGAVLVTALLALVSCKSVNKREIGRDASFYAIGPTVKPEEAYKYRYQVAVGSNCGQNCGGTIISDRLILTAAHCVYGADPKSLTIKAGITYVNDPNAQIGEVFDIKIHRNYIPPSSLNDIALLLLQEPLNVSKLTVAKLPETNENFVDEIFEVSGWGSTRNLTYALFTVKEGPPACEHKSRLCGVAVSPNMATIQGDSGGPAVIRKGNEVILIGAVRGMDEGYYIFSNVAKLRPWIDEAINQAMRTARVADRFRKDLPKHRCR